MDEALLGLQVLAYVVSILAVLYASVIAVANRTTGLEVFVGKPRKYSWRQIDQAADRLTEQIRKSNFQPDVVLGPGRGGAVFAGILAGRLKAPSVETLDRAYYEDSNGILKVHFPKVPRRELIYNKRVLFVEPLPRKLETFREAIRVLREMEPKDLRTATIYTPRDVEMDEDYSVWVSKEFIAAPWHPPDFKQPETREELRTPPAP